jgi:hypothetical protein
MDYAAKLDEYGKPAWIGLMVVGFILFWPIGLAILGYMIWSGRMGCWKKNGFGKARGRWYEPQSWSQSSGNSAFDEYRQETLRRLEEEQQEFVDFLERLRQARDKAEFDQFMAERRRNGRASDQTSGPGMPGAEPQQG